MIKKRGQSAVEFSLLISFMFIIFTLFLYYATERMAESKKEADYAALSSIGKAVQAELEVAFTTEPGYHRNFTIPINSNGRGYSIDLLTSITESIIKLKYTEESYTMSFSLPDSIKGTVNPGLNFVLKNETGVFVNE